MNKELGYSYPIEKVRENIIDIVENTNDIIFVAQQSNDEIIGYIHGSSYNTLYFDSLINILGFVVKSEFRGEGIGNILISKLEDFAKENGYSGLRLVSGIDRLDAHRFYQKHDYINRKNQKNFIKIFD